MAQTTYYFDAHNGIADIDGAWFADSNAFNGNTTDYAYIQASGNEFVNALLGSGTDSPDTGSDTISLVEIRAYVSDDGTGIGWSSYSNLSEPTGGWTWEKVSELEISLFLDQTSNWDIKGYVVSSSEAIGVPNFYDNTVNGYQRVYKIEVRVTHEAPPAPEAPVLTGRSGAFLAFF